MCRSDTSDSSEAASVKKIRKRANRGDANAMYNLGGYYDTGRLGVIQNQALARIWYQKAAEKGEARGAAAKMARAAQSIKLKLQSIFEWLPNWGT